MQRERNVTDRAGEIDSYFTSMFARACCNRLDVEPLPREKIDAREKYERNLLPFPFQDRLDRLRPNREIIRARLRQKKRALGIEAVMNYLRLDGVRIGGKSRRLHQDFE